MNENTQFITTQDASKLLYLTEYTIRKYIRNGTIKAIKLNKHYLIHKSEIERILQSHLLKSEESKKETINV